MAALAAISAAALCFLALASQKWCFSTDGWETHSRGHSICGVLVIWCIYAWSQTVSLPTGVVRWLSGGSHAAYTSWAGPLMESPMTWFPVSIAPMESRGTVAMLAMIALVAWVSPMIFNHRQRITWLLGVSAASGAIVGCIGITRQVVPGFQLWSFVESSAPFSTFVNRNNAALFINLGFAAALGILVRRAYWLADGSTHVSTAVNSSAAEQSNSSRSGQRLWSRNGFQRLLTDPESIYALVCGLACVISILASGSRGGLTGIGAGLVVAVSTMVKHKSGMKKLLLVSAIIVVALPWVLPASVLPQAYQRIGDSIREPSNAGQDGRLLHWPDGLRTAVKHLPLGSGLSTYSYAYLPYQESSPEDWYHHADNLWLELLVEQGLPGVSFAVILFWLLVRALRRLGRSQDAMDHGLQAMGYFLCGLLITSQTFDFGLIIPANLFIVAVWVTVLVSRGEQAPAVSSPLSKQPGKSQTRRLKLKTSTPWRATAYGIAVTGLALAAMPTLAARAWSEAMVESVSAELAVISDSAFDLSKREAALRQISERWKSVAGQHYSAKSMQQWFDLQYELGRVLETEQVNLLSDNDAIAFYDTASQARRRSLWRNSSYELKSVDNQGNPSPAYSQYQRCAQLQRESLRRYPLAVEPRQLQINLDFLHKDTMRSRTAIEQTTRLFRNNHDIVLEGAKQLADDGKFDDSAKLFRRAITLRPRETMTVANQAMRYPEIQLNAILPDIPQSFRQVAHYYRASKRVDDATLERIYQGMQCNDCLTAKERSGCETNAGEIAWRLDRRLESIQHFSAAVKLEPANANLRWRLIKAYETLNRTPEAKQEARRGRELRPDDKRFENYLGSAP